MEPGEWGACPIAEEQEWMDQFQGGQPRKLNPKGAAPHRACP